MRRGSRPKLNSSKLEMARHAIHGRMVLAMTFDAKPHGVVHFSLGNRQRAHVAVAFGAVDSRPDMGRMVELDVRGRFETVDPLPGDVLPARAIGRELLDFRLVGSDYLMARHAEIDAWNSRVRALIHAYVAIRALQAIGEVNFVRIGDRLDGF